MQENMFRDWLNRRKISDAIISEFNVHWGENPTIGECIVIPVHNEAGVFSFNKYRRSPADLNTPKYIYDKGGKVTLYGWYKAKDNDTVLITEGEMDCLVAWSAHIAAVSSTGGAMSFQEEWCGLLAHKEVILCFDNDSAGGTGMAKVFGMLPHAKVLFLPDRVGVKDISDYASTGGVLGDLIKTARGFTGIEDVMEDRARRISMYQSTHFHDAYIKNNTKPAYAHNYQRDENETDRISRAKGFPINELIELKGGKCRCLWHAEKTPSLVYYPKTNTMYCFGGCGRAYDAIDVYRKINNCSFKEAVDRLQ